MNIFDTMTALFSGERVSHTDTFIPAGVVLALLIGIWALRTRMQSKDEIETHHLPLGGFFALGLATGSARQMFSRF